MNNDKVIEEMLARIQALEEKVAAQSPSHQDMIWELLLI